MKIISPVLLPYILFAGLWLFLSDWLLYALLTDPATITQWSMYIENAGQKDFYSMSCLIFEILNLT